MLEVYLAILTSFWITFISIPIVITVVRKNDALLDRPTERASHNVSIPTFGGIAIFFGILFSMIFWLDLALYEGFQTLLSALLIIFFTGVVDDFVTLSPLKKVVGQLLAILLVIYFSDLRITSMNGLFTIHELPSSVSVLLTVFTMIVITNAFNLIDGLDGLAGSVGIIIASSFGFLFLITNQLELALVSLSLMGALLAFLYFNFHPARIFMGDTGSLVIGFLFSVFAVHLVETDVVWKGLSFEAKGAALAIAILIVPLYDALRVFVVRLSKGKSPMKPDRNHIHHGLSDLGFGHRRTSLYICLANLFFIGLVILLEPLGINYTLLIILGAALLLSQIPFWIKKRRK